MTDPRTAASARAAAHPIQRLGATWMLHPEQFQASLDAGYEHPFAGYFAGRGGVLGDTQPAVVDAAFGIFGPGVTEIFWPMGLTVHGSRGGAELYFRQAAEWARPRLDGVVGLDRFIVLGEKVLDAAPRLGLPIFAAQVLLPRVEDLPGRAMQVALLLRELRFGIHLAAMAATGLPMHPAHLLNQGPAYAEMLGFLAPHPETEPWKGKLAEVEAITDAADAETWAAALTAEEAAELAGIAALLHERIRHEDPAAQSAAGA